MKYEKLPKIELHVHLDCSLSYRAVRQLNSAISEDRYRKLFVAPPSCSDLKAYISHAKPAIDLMQSKKGLEIVTSDLVRQFADDNVIYGEIRFAPLEHCNGGLSELDVVRVVERAVEKASREFQIEAFLILCSLRPYKPEESLKVAHLAEEFKGSRVVGIDLAGDELLDAGPHRSAFDFALENDIRRTCHAGEARGPESVEEVLDQFKPHRIGHGVRSLESEKTVKRLLKEQIHLEVCPTSNLLTGIYDQMESHGIRKLRDKGVSLSVNTDGRAISDVTLTDEWNKLHQALAFEKADFFHFNCCAIDNAFAPASVVEKTAARLKNEWRLD